MFQKPNKIRLIILTIILLITVVFGTLIITDKNHVLLAKIIGTKEQAKETKIILKIGTEKKEFVTQKTTLQDVLNDNNVKLSKHDIIAPTIDTKIDAYTLLFVDLEKKYSVTIIDKKSKKKFITDKNVVKDILKEQNIKLAKEDAIDPGLKTTIEDNAKIKISRANTVAIFVDDKTKNLKTLDSKVSKILTKANIKLGKDDYTVPNEDTNISGNVQIQIIRVTKKQETTKEDIGFKAETQYSDQLYEDEQQVSQEGQNGILERIYEIKLENDKEVSKKLLSEKTALKPQNKIIVYGTKKHPVGQSYSGRATYYYGPTAAACNLFPAGTRLRVTNTNNGKSVEVVVDDTGGFGLPTVIDLRQDIFNQIAGPYDDGIMQVTIEQLL